MKMLQEVWEKKAKREQEITSSAALKSSGKNDLNLDRMTDRAY